MVRMERLELSLPKELDFESSASTDSTTSACFVFDRYAKSVANMTKLTPSVNG